MDRASLEYSAADKCPVTTGHIALKFAPLSSGQFRMGIPGKPPAVAM